MGLRWASSSQSPVVLENDPLSLGVFVVLALENDAFSLRDFAVSVLENDPFHAISIQGYLLVLVLEHDRFSLSRCGPPSGQTWPEDHSDGLGTDSGALRS